MNLKKYLFISISILILVPLFFIFDSKVASAAVYYISPLGADTKDGQSEANAWKTFSHAFSTMIAGNELVLLDGVYSEAAGTGYISYQGINSGQPPSGTSLTNMTIVRAKNSGNVTITGALFLGRSFRKDSYIKIQGVKFEGRGSFYNTSYDTLKDCGFYGGFGIGTNDHENGNTYNLIEDCWIWAYGARIVAINYRSDYNVWRRVVIRGDGGYSYVAGSPCVGLSVYESAYISLQNVIVVDRILTASPQNGYPYADFATAQHTSGAHLLGPNEWLGCISLKAPDSAYYFEADNSNDNTITMRNCVAWASSGSGFNVSSGTFKNVLLENLTSGYANFDGVRIRGTQSGILRNLISTHAGRYGINTEFVVPGYSDVFSSVSNAYYGNNPNIGGKTTDPQNDGTPTSLKYICRIEDDSLLKGSGYSGGDYGANVIKRYGVDGSRYGESGYNTLTNTNLWPWPNEDRIKSDMSVSSTRGFCASGQTLTSYIWEYLGNPCPAEICNYNIQYHPADLNQNGKIEMHELISFISQWKSGQVTLSEVLIVLNRWLSGI